MESNPSIEAQRQLAELERIQEETWLPSAPTEPVEQPPLWNRILGSTLVVVVMVGFLATWYWLQVQTDDAWWVLLGGIAVVFASIGLLRRAATKSTGVKHPYFMPRGMFGKLMRQMWPVAVMSGVLVFALGRAVDQEADWWVFATIVAVYFAVATPLQILVSKHQQADNEGDRKQASS